MKAFDLHSYIVEDYKTYLHSFTNIMDERVKSKVDQAFKEGVFLPEPFIQFNPSFQPGESVDDLINDGTLQKEIMKIFCSINLYKHQIEAARKGVESESLQGKPRLVFIFINKI